MAHGRPSHRVSVGKISQRAIHDGQSLKWLQFSMLKNHYQRLFCGAFPLHLKGHQKTGQSSLARKEKRTSLPMLAKRFIVAAFAAFVVFAAPFVFAGQSDLFVDTPPALMTTVAAN
jgi:hypothetical protein